MISATKKKKSNTFRSQTACFTLKELFLLLIATPIIRSIGKIRGTEVSLNTRLSNDVKFDSNIYYIFRNIATR